MRDYLRVSNWTGRRYVSACFCLPFVESWVTALTLLARSLELKQTHAPATASSWSLGIEIAAAPLRGDECAGNRLACQILLKTVRENNQNVHIGWLRLQFVFNWYLIFIVRTDPISPSGYLIERRPIGL